jgi:glycerate dehydrogenase
MRIVVLDGATLNPGDLDWSPLRALGECTLHDRTPQAAVTTRARGADALLVNKVFLPAATLRALPELRYVGVLATGFDRVDIAVARERGIVVTNVPAYGTESVAQAVFALLLELVCHTGQHAAGVRAGRWSRSEDFCYWDAPLIELAGLLLGVVGFGAIGQAVARIARGFGMRVVASDLRAMRGAAAPDGTKRLPLDELLAASDVVSLHLPLTKETQGLMSAQRIACMKPSAYLLNTARGGLVDSEALAAALRNGRLAGAGLDVLDVEPPPADHPLLSAPRCIVTPHVAWATTAARQRLLDAVIENLRAWLAGNPRNVVSEDSARETLNRAVNREP